MRNGKFLAREVLNLARFISVMKFRPLTWRLAHPYLLTDRFEVGGKTSAGLVYMVAETHVQKCAGSSSWVVWSFSKPTHPRLDWL